MSEYITVDIETTDDPQLVIIHTNQKLAPDGREDYPDIASGEEGSPLAQSLFTIDGLQALIIEDGDLRITCGPELELFSLIDEVRAILTDFFL